MFRQDEALRHARGRDLRPEPFIELRDLAAARMARGVNQAMRSVMTSTPCLMRSVDDAADLALVAGNGARGKDHAVAGRELHDRMLIFRNTGDAARLSPWLPVASITISSRGSAEKASAGEKRMEHLRDSRIRARRSTTRSIARPTSTTLRPAALAASATARIRATLEAKVVTTRPAARLADDLMQGQGDLGLRGADAIRRILVEIANEREHALIADLGEPLDFGLGTKSRLRIDLPIAGVKHRAERRADRQRAALRDRMRHRHQFDSKGSSSGVSLRYRLHRDLVRRARSAARLEAARRRRRRINGHRTAATGPQRRRCDPHAHG